MNKKMMNDKDLTLTGRVVYLCQHVRKLCNH